MRVAYHDVSGRSEVVVDASSSFVGARDKGFAEHRATPPVLGGASGVTRPGVTRCNSRR